MEVQDLQHRVDDLHSGQRMTESKVETVLQMQHKIMRKLESIEKTLCGIPLQHPSSAHSIFQPHPPSTPFSSHPPSTLFSPSTFPPHPPCTPFSSRANTTPSPFHPAIHTSSTPLTDPQAPHASVPPTQYSSTDEEYHTMPRDSLREPKPIFFSKLALPSASIPKNTLRDPEEVAEESKDKANDTHYTQFALRLAHKAFFGRIVLAQCSVMGEKGNLGLPRAELSALKIAVFRKFPQYWNNRSDFEPLWNRCVDAINGACRRERAAMKKRN